MSLFLCHPLITRPAACGRWRRTSPSSGSSARRRGLEEARLVNLARQSSVFPVLWQAGFSVAAGRRRGEGEVVERCRCACHVLVVHVVYAPSLVVPFFAEVFFYQDKLEVPEWWAHYIILFDPHVLSLHEAFSIHTLFQCCVDQVRLVHLIFQTLVPRERVQTLVGKQIVDVPVSKILVQIVEPVAYRRQATARVDVRGAGRLQALGDSTGGRAFSGTTDRTQRQLSVSSCTHSCPG